MEISPKQVEAAKMFQSVTTRLLEALSSVDPRVLAAVMSAEEAAFNVKRCEHLRETWSQMFLMMQDQHQQLQNMHRDNLAIHQSLLQACKQNVAVFDQTQAMARTVKVAELNHLLDRLDEHRKSGLLNIVSNL